MKKYFDNLTEALQNFLIEVGIADLQSVPTN